MRWRLIVASLYGLAAATACSEHASSTPENAQTYVGRVDGGDVRLALVRTGDAFEAYVCGTGATLLTHTRWFQGGADGGTLEAVTDGWRLRMGAGAQGEDGLTGELKAPDGAQLSWSATLAQAGTEEGLYDANHAGCRDGIIVWKALAGPACEAQGSWCDALGQRGQITPVSCTPDEPLRVQGIAGGVAFELIGERVDAP